MKFKFLLLIFILFITSCKQIYPEVKLDDPNSNLEMGFHLFTASVEEGLSGTYIDENRIIYFETKRGEELNPIIEWVYDNSTPPYPIDARYKSLDCGDSFIMGAGGSGLMDSSWGYVDPNRSIELCEGNKRLEDFRIAWKIADELEKLNLSSDLKWEKMTLIDLARSIKEEDLHYNDTI